MKIAQYVETFSYVGMFNTMNFASYICLYLISPYMQHPVYCVTYNSPAVTYIEPSVTNIYLW